MAAMSFLGQRHEVSRVVWKGRGLRRSYGVPAKGIRDKGIRHVAIGLLALGMLMMAPLASAHPHGWVDYTVRVLFDDQGRMTALEQHWKMDPFYSLTLTEELARVKDGGSMQQRLDTLGHEIVTNLAREHYLTHVYRGEKELELG